MTDLPRVEKVVLEVLHDLSKIEAGKILIDDRLLEDLRITGDDLTFVFVPEVERALGIKTQPTVWQGVSTVRQAIDVLTTATASR